MDLAFHVVFDPLPEKQFWAYNLTLFNASMKPITSVIGNEDWYHRWCVLAGTGLPGTGGAIRLVETYYVEIRHPDKSEMGFLRVESAPLVRSSYHAGDGFGKGIGGS